MGVIQTALSQTVFQLLAILGPFALAAVILHVLERIIETRLASRFGWSSVLWTGWIGTPVHELSHVVGCLLFGHRIRKIALFQPDMRAARLGYVTHSYNPRNPYHVIGAFFIGTAPLIGGALVLYGLLWLFFPQTAEAVGRDGDASESAGDLVAAGKVLQAGGELISQISRIFFEIVTVENIISWRLWVFLYLALCVGSHLAPSGSDYRGATRGGVFLLGLLIALNFIAALAGFDEALAALATRLLSPVLALFALCIVLCSMTAGLVYAATSAFPVRYRVVRK